MATHELANIACNYRTDDSRVGYSVDYWIKSTDDLSSFSIKSARDYVFANIAAPGDTYAISGETDSTAGLKRVDVTLKPGSKNPYVFMARLAFEDPDPDSDSGQDSSGNPSVNPLDWRPTVELRTMQTFKPAEKARYIGGYIGKADTVLKTRQQNDPDNRTALVCSNLYERFDPPAEIEDSWSVLRVTRNYSNFDSTVDDAIRPNIVNDQAIWFQARGISKIIPPYAGKVRDLVVLPKRYNGIEGAGLPPFDYVTVSAEIVIIDNWQDDWRLRPVDRGYKVRRMVGDPDGAPYVAGTGGGYVTDEPPAGQPPIDWALDSNGEPVTEPILLNGDGQPLITQAGSVEEPVFSEWQYYEELNWFTLPFFQGMLF